MDNNSILKLIIVATLIISIIFYPLWLSLLFLIVIFIIEVLWYSTKPNKKSNIKENEPFSNNFNINHNEEYHKIGTSFEQYIINLFDPSFFSIYDCSRDNSKHFNRRVESDKNPDLTMRYIPKDELFSIECKFRSSTYDDKVKWAREDQIINYLSYATKTKIPTFVVIGLGGSPDNPKKMFCLPIADAKYPELFLSTLRKYERSPNKNFFWEDGILR